jgi:hypothetical protein
MYEERGMDMLTTAVAMSAGREQAGVLPAFSDRVQVKGASFAKSFDREVALAGDAATKTSSDENAPEARNLMRGAALQVPDELVVTSTVKKAGTGSAQAGAVSEGSKSIAVAMSVNGSPVSIVLAAKTGFGMKTQGGGSVEAAMSTGTSDGVVTAVDDANPALGLLVQTPKEEVGAVQKSTAGTIDEVVGAHPVVQEDTPAVAAADVFSTKVVRSKGQDRPVVLRDAGEATGNKKTTAESTVPVASAKKASKGQERKAAHTTAQETANAIQLVTVAGANAPLDVGALVDTSVPVAAVVPVAVQSNGAIEISKDSSGNVIGKAIGTTAVAKDGGAAPDQGKAGSGAAPVVASADEAGSAKAGSESAKSVVLALAVGNGDAGKTLKADAAAGLSHDAAAGSPFAGLTSGVVPLHGVGVAVGTNVQAQDGSAQTTTGLHAGHGELDGGGGATPLGMDGAHRMLAATPTTLEVGIANGTHGWLKIRAELATGGGVNASLSAASPAGQEMLHRELPSLAAYLQQEQVTVNSVVVHPAMAGNDSHGLAGGMGGDVSGQAQQRNDRGGETRQGLNDPVSSYVEEVIYNGANGVGADGLLSPVTYAGGGSWLNVRA